MDRPRVGISACLLGDAVRYDGGHKRDALLTDVLGAHVDWVPLCPEVEVGMGVPREPVRLVRRAGLIRMVTVRTNVDHTAAMDAWARQRLDALASERLAGYVLKKDSPSCGIEAVKVHDRIGAPEPSGRGLFADALMRRFPLLPVEDEARLSDPAVREHFLERVFAGHRLRMLLEGRWTVDTLAAFHAAHEPSLKTRSPGDCSRLGRLVEGGGSLPRDELRDRYERLFMRAMAVMPGRGRRL